MNLKKTFCRLATALSLALPFNAAAQEQHGAETVEYKYSENRIEALRHRAARSALGRSVLDYLRERDIQVVLTTAQKLDDAPGDGFSVNGRSYGSVFSLNGDVDDNEALLFFMHEARHSWQMKTAEVGLLWMDLKKGWMATRLKEADAFAFMAHFQYEHEKKTGEKLKSVDQWSPCDNYYSYACLYKKYKEDRDGGKPLEESYAILFKNSFRHLQTLNYDDAYLEKADKQWEAASKGNILTLPFLVQAGHASSDERFAEVMRRLGVIGFDLHREENVLKDWAVADFISVEKTGGASHKHGDWYKAIDKLYYQKAMKDFRTSAENADVMHRSKTPKLSLKKPIKTKKKQQKKQHFNK